MAMERAEKQGLAVAAVGHVALFAILSLGLFSARIPKPPVADSMEVTIADQVGLRSAATQVSPEAPKASTAPERGSPSESAPPPPPAPEPTPPPPEPKPTPPEPRPAPKPTPPRPEPKPTPPKPKPTPPEPRPAPKPTPPRPEPKPEKPKPTPEKAKPAPAKPAPSKPAPAKPAPAKSAPAQSAPSKPAAKAAPGLSSDLLKDLPKDAGRGAGKTKGDAKPKGARLDRSILEGIGSDAKGTAAKPRAAAVSARSMAGLAALIAAQVKPCYSPPSGGADATAIVTTLRLRFNKDGSVASPPTVADQSGGNPAYGRQMADAAKRAVLRCAPLKLPAELYQGGWEDIEFVFRPEAMG